MTPPRAIDSLPPATQAAIRARVAEILTEQAHQVAHPPVSALARVAPVWRAAGEQVRKARQETSR